MSGLCGWVRFDGGEVEPAVLQAMAAAAAHRGPDGIRRWCSGEVGLAHLALRETPESVREEQPLVGAEGKLVLVADARIDNRDELAAALGAAGDGTDADLILSAYRRWGVECPARLIGDFAFAVWDAGERRLFAARDPLGMRAFYFRVEPERVVFATEIKQLLEVPGVPVRPFEPAVGAYLAGVFGPADWTFYEGIAQLAPGHALVVDPGGHRTWRYWDVDPGHRIRYAREEQYAEHFLELFKEAVRARLRSTRPVGVLLSGGLDSGSIAATAGWLAERGRAPVPEVRAYSFAWEEMPECDERHISAITARRYGLEVTEVPADTAWPLADYPAHGPDRDEPFIGAYQALLERALGRARDEGVGRMLTGHRGDLVGGMNLFDLPALLRSGRWGRLLAELRLLSRHRNVPFSRIVRGQLLGPMKAAFIETVIASPPFPFFHRRLPRPRDRPSRVPDWIRKEFIGAVDLAEIAKSGAPRSPIRGYARRERHRMILMPLHMRAVVWSERTHARSGLAFADPWSDRRIMAFATAVPQRVLNTAAASKRLTREAMRGVMPEEARRGARKISPQPFYDSAIRHRARETILDLVTNSLAERRGYIDGAALRRRYDRIVTGEADDSCLWWALSLEMWLRRYWS